MSDDTKTERASEIADAIVRAVVEQRLPPGTRLGEDEIGATFGVSRTIVRAALRMLGRDAIVTMRPNRGAAVASLSSHRVVRELDAIVQQRGKPLMVVSDNVPRAERRR